MPLEVDVNMRRVFDIEFGSMLGSRGRDGYAIQINTNKEKERIQPIKIKTMRTKKHKK